MEVSVFSFGTWQLADDKYWGSGGNADATVRAAIDAGINLFDSAEGYAAGESEKALGRALGADRNKVLIATKISRSHCIPDQVRPACERSLKRLSTDCIDIYQVHWPSHEILFADTFGELQKLKQEGKIREIGVSNFGKQDMDDWMVTGTAVSNQLGYNLLFRAIEYEIIPTCQKHEVGILTYMPLMQGILADVWNTIEEIPPTRRRTRHFSSQQEGTRHGEEGQEELTFETLRQLREVANEICQPLANVAMAWTLAQPGITSITVGGRKPEQLRRNLGSVDLELGPEIIERLNNITDPLKECLGRNADMWNGTENSRIR